MNGEQTHVPATKELKWKNKYFRFCTGLACLTSVILFILLLTLPLGRIDKQANTKSMHYTLNNKAVNWWSLFPSQVYMENMQIQSYRVVDGNLDRLDVNEQENHGFQIAGGYGILTNISSNVYFSAVLVIYVISLLDATIYPENKSKKDRKEMKRTMYFSWAIGLFAVFFLLMHLILNFNTYTESKWGKSNVEVFYMWEAGASIVYAFFVVVLFLVHTNIKNYTWHHIFVDTTVYETHKVVTGTEESGPYSHEAHYMFAVSFFLFIMGLLGDTRQVVLETEAQLLVLCAVGLSVLTIFFEHARAFHLYVERYLDGETHKIHRNMVQRSLILVELIALAVSFTLFGIAMHILSSMYDSNSISVLFICVLLITSAYMFLKLVVVLMHMYYSYYSEPMITFKKAFKVYKFYYIGSIGVFLGFLIVMFITSSQDFNQLVFAELAPYAGADKSVLNKNTICEANGMQSNGLLFQELSLTTDQKVNGVDLSLSNLDKNPVAFKVNSWIKWLSVKSETQTLDAKVYLCSTGFEQQFGSCRAQYRERNGKVYNSNMQGVLNNAAANFNVAPA